MKNTLYIISILFVVLTACEKELKINTTKEENKIVINSIINTDSVFTAEVTKTFSPYNNINVEELKDAEVTVFENDIFIEKLTYNKFSYDSLGKFRGTFIPQLNKQYKIEVTTQNSDLAQAKTSIPEKVTISNTQAIEVKWGEDNLTSRRFNFSFTLNDLEGEDYYYLIIAFPVFKIDTINHDTSFLEFQYCEIETGDLPQSQLYLRNGLVFNDKAFNTTNHIVSGSATTYADAFSENTNYYSWDEREKVYYVNFNKIYIYLQHLNKELYQFYSSHAKMLKNQDDLYSEPVPVYSNIENGYGIFAGENTTLEKVNVELLE